MNLHGKALSVGFSKLSDTFGRRNMIVVAWMFFSGFSIACALANTMEHL
jgi:MFS family permease